MLNDEKDFTEKHVASAGGVRSTFCKKHEGYNYIKDKGREGECEGDFEGHCNGMQ